MFLRVKIDDTITILLLRICIRRSSRMCISMQPRYILQFTTWPFSAHSSPNPMLQHTARPTPS